MAELATDFSIDGDPTTESEVKGHLPWVLADWARYKEMYGERVTARHLISLDGEQEGVLWVEREGIDLETGRVYVKHHLVCEHVAEAVKQGDARVMLSCKGLWEGMMARARQIREEDEALKLALNIPSNLLSAAELRMKDGDPRIVRGIMHLVTVDLNSPNSWGAANMIAGRHEIPVVADVLDIELDETALYAQRLHERGLVSLQDGAIIQWPRSSLQTSN
jgi:hypothetical protein